MKPMPQFFLVTSLFVICVGCTDFAASQQQAEQARQQKTKDKLREIGEAMHKQQSTKAAADSMATDSQANTPESPQDSIDSPNTPKPTQIRAGDNMKTVLRTLSEWNATEYEFARYSVLVPFEGEDPQDYERRWERELSARKTRPKEPYAYLQSFQLPNGLVITLCCSGEVLDSITKELPGDSKETATSIEGFVGLQYDEDWKLVSTEPG